MADDPLPLNGSYQETKTYKEASPERRRQLNRYKKECGISDDHMLLLMVQHELDGISDEARKKASTTSNVVLIFAVLLFFSSMSTFREMSGGAASMGFFALSFASFLLAIGVYFSGVLNPYKRTQRTLKKRLKGLPEVPDFTEWDLAHPVHKSQMTQRKRKR